MLKKLLKYDFKFLFKTTFPLFTLAPILALFCRIATKIGDKLSLLNIPIKFIMVLSVLFMVFLPFVTFIIGVYKYYNSMVKDEGYLLHTLPVKKGDIIFSKIFTSTIFLVLSIIISIVSIFIAFNIGNDVFKYVKELLKTIYDQDKLLLVVAPISIMLGYIVDVMIVYAAIALGQKHTMKKLFSVLYGIGLYGINQFVMSIVLYAPALFIPNYLDRMENPSSFTGYLNYMFVVIAIVYLALIIVYFAITNHFMSKKLNLD